MLTMCFTILLGCRPQQTAAQQNVDITTAKMFSTQQPRIWVANIFSIGPPDPERPKENTTKPPMPKAERATTDATIDTAITTMIWM